MKTRQCILVVWIRCTAIWVEENITTPPAASKDSSAKGGEEEEEEEASFSDAVGGGGIVALASVALALAAAALVAGGNSCNTIRVGRKMLAGHTRRICHSMARWARTTSLSPMSRRLAKRSEFEVSFHKNDQKIIINSHAILFGSNRGKIGMDSR
jgi:hypothetical protein